MDTNRGDMSILLRLAAPACPAGACWSCCDAERAPLASTESSQQDGSERMRARGRSFGLLRTRREPAAVLMQESEERVECSEKSSQVMNFVLDRRGSTKNNHMS